MWFWLHVRVLHNFFVDLSHPQPSRTWKVVLFPEISSLNSHGNSWGFQFQVYYTDLLHKLDVLHSFAPKIGPNWWKNPNNWYFVQKCATNPKMPKFLKFDHNCSIYSHKKAEKGSFFYVFDTYANHATPERVHTPLRTCIYIDSTW